MIYLIASLTKPTFIKKYENEKWDFQVIRDLYPTWTDAGPTFQAGVSFSSHLPPPTSVLDVLMNSKETNGHLHNIINHIK